MAKKAYIGVDGVARKIKKGYIGVENLARKIKKAYIGIGGVARPCWSGGELAYYGTITELSRSRRFLTGVSLGNYALFCGGATTTSGSDFSNVDAYNKTLTRSSATGLTNARRSTAATTVGGYAVLGGGGRVRNATNWVDAYTTNLTKSNPTSLSVNVQGLGAAFVGNYALFAGGRSGASSSSTYNSKTVVNAYDTSLTRTLPTELSVARFGLTGASIGNYALFAGGRAGTSSSNYSYSNVVDSYDTSLTRTTITALSSGRTGTASTNVGDYTLFGGGYNSNYYSAVVDVYNISLTRTTATQLSVGRQSLAATSVEGFALFGGGDAELYDDTGVSVVDAYDESLTRTTPNELSVGRNSLGAASVGKYALFAGGLDDDSAYRSEVDAYVVI